MKRDKELNLTHSKSNSQWWRMGLIWGFIVTFGILNFSCDNGDEISVSDEYFVKYGVYSSTIYFGGKLNVTLGTENNTNMTITIDQRKLWETVIGPVQKGFNATLKVNSVSETYNQLRLYTYLYVSKNGSPFALKKSDSSDTPRDSVKINYPIDY